MSSTCAAMKLSFFAFLVLFVSIVCPVCSGSEVEQHKRDGDERIMCPAECTSQCCRDWVSVYGMCGQSAAHKSGGINCTSCPEVAAGCVRGPPITHFSNKAPRAITKMLINEPAKVLACYILKNGCSNLIHLMFTTANQTYRDWSSLAAPLEVRPNTSPWTTTFGRTNLELTFVDKAYTRVCCCSMHLCFRFGLLLHLRRSDPQSVSLCKHVAGRVRS